MDRPKRQTKARWKYDEDEFVIPEEAAQMYWEANTRKVYRVLGFKDIKTSLKNTEVHILWPDDGKWYLAEVEQIRVKDKIAYLRYPETNEEEEANLQELIRDKCIAVIEHLPKDAKLKRGREFPVSKQDAEGAEYEDCDSEPERSQQQDGSQQHKSATPGSARKPKDEDSDFDAEEDSDAEVLSDDEKFDSDAHVSDDEVVSDHGEDGQAVAAATKPGGTKKKHSNKHKDGHKLNTPSKGTKRVSGGPIGPVAAPGGPQQQQLLPMGSGAGAQAGGMMFVPTGATGVATAGLDAASLGPFAGNGAQWGPAGQQGMLGKKRGAEGPPGNHAKRHAGASGSDDASGSDAFKKAMLEKLLARRSLAAGSAASGGATPAAAAAGGVGRMSSGFAARKSMERRLSASGSGGPLARALSDVDVRQKAAAQLAVGLKKAVEEAQAKHKQQQQQKQEGQPAAAAGAAGAAAAAGAAGEQQQGEQAAAPAELQLPDPQQLATTIEQHLFELCGSVNNEYKSKLRSLAFNLRDPQNPDIREHVLKGEVAPANLVRMSAADLANKDLAEWRRKIEEEHNKAIELDVEAAAKFSTAAAWATREGRLKQAELALMGILAQEKTRKTTPEPERTSPYADTAAAAAAAAGEDKDQQLRRRESESGNAGLSEGREQQQSGSAGALAGEGEDWDAADAAGGATPTHPADDGAGTPTHPASEDGVNMEIDQPERGTNDGTNSNAAAATGDNQTELQQQRSEQLSNLSGAAGAALAAAGDSTATPSMSASLGLPAGSVAGGMPGALQQLGSVTSKTTGGLLAGINWAAIKNEALKAVPKEQLQAALVQQQDAAAGTGGRAGAGSTAAVAAAAADDAPYNPDDEDDDGQPYDPSEEANVGSAAGSAAAVPASQGAAAAGAAATASPVDPHLPDFLPVISTRPKESPAGPMPGDTVWHGSFAVPGGGAFAAMVKHVGGMGEVGHMLGPAGSSIEIIGRVALDKFADFTEELRKSRSRTISLGVVGVTPNVAAVDAAFMHELLRSYSSKGRIGKLALAKEVEGYLVAKSEYASRLLKTAIIVAPSQQQHLLPREVASSEFLLLLVHRKDYAPPRHGAGRAQQQTPQQMPPLQLQQQPVPGVPGSAAPPPPVQQPVPSSDGGRLDPRRRAAAAGQQQQQQAGAVQPPPPPVAAPGSAADASPGPGQAATAAPASAAPPAGLDLNSLSALAAALGLPGAPAAPAVAPGSEAPAAAGAHAGSNGAGGGLPWTTLGGAAAAGEQLQLQQMPGGAPGPPPPPAGVPTGPSSGSAQGPSSGGAPAGLFAALQQLQQALPPPPSAAACPGPDGQQQQHYNTLDLRPMQGPPGPTGAEQMVFDLRQQQQHQLPPPPDPATLRRVPAPPAPGAAGGAPVIILPPGAAVPAPGTVGIPDGAVFMTQDPATGALIPVSGNLPPGAPILGPPGAPLPPGMFPPGHGPPPGAVPPHGGPPPPPPPPYDPIFADQPPPYGFEGPPPPEYGLPPPPHHFGAPPRPRVPGGGPPRPMVRSQRGPPGGGPPRY